MDIVYISNGLGNQMSEYAMYLRRKHEGNRAVYACKDKLHNGVELDKVFGIPVNRGLLNFIYLVIGHIMMVPYPNLFLKLLRNLFRRCGVRVYCENYQYDYHPEVINTKSSSLLLIAGGWHHWKYMEGIEERLRKIYVFKHFTSAKNIRVSKLADNNRAVAIHIRRGDYLTGGNYEKYGSVCNEKYYLNAINHIESIISSPIYYVFSNDMEWAKVLLEGKEYVCVDWNTKENSWADMALMSKFHHIIIANSTFSWWAAWLGSKDKVVVCPPVLMNGDAKSDIYPPEWHHIYKY